MNKLFGSLQSTYTPPPTRRLHHKDCVPQATNSETLPRNYKLRRFVHSVDIIARDLDGSVFKLLGLIYGVYCTLHFVHDRYLDILVIAGGSHIVQL